MKMQSEKQQCLCEITDYNSKAQIQAETQNVFQVQGEGKGFLWGKENE